MHKESLPVPTPEIVNSGPVAESNHCDPMQSPDIPELDLVRRYDPQERLASHVQEEEPDTDGQNDLAETVREENDPEKWESGEKLCIKSDSVPEVRKSSNTCDLENNLESKAEGSEYLESALEIRDDQDTCLSSPDADIDDRGSPDKDVSVVLTDDLVEGNSRLPLSRSENCEPDDINEENSGPLRAEEILLAKISDTEESLPLNSNTGEDLNPGVGDEWSLPDVAGQNEDNFADFATDFDLGTSESGADSAEWGRLASGPPPTFGIDRLAEEEEEEFGDFDDVSFVSAGVPMADDKFEVTDFVRFILIVKFYFLR